MRGGVLFKLIPMILSLMVYPVRGELLMVFLLLIRVLLMSSLLLIKWVPGN